MYLVYDYVGLLLMMNILTIAIFHVTCIIPQIGSKPLTPQDLTKQQDKAAAMETENIENWLPFWDFRDTTEKNRFTSAVLLGICRKNTIVIPRNVSKTIANLKNAVNIWLLTEENASQPASSMDVAVSTAAAAV